jgi:Holliday junction resolvase
MANRNRNAGHLLERDIVHRLKEMGYDAVTSRQESRSADARGIDIISDFPMSIQCKATVNKPKIHEILTETDAEVIVWRKMEKKGKRFYSQGEYAILPLDEFFKLFKK